MKRFRNPQREIARRLIKAVGITGAIHFARQNQWEGIVTQILNLRALARITSAPRIDTRIAPRIDMKESI